MSRLPRITGNELLKILCNKFDYKILRIRGSHATLFRNGRKFTAWVSNKELDFGTLNGILEDAGITREEFCKEL